MTSSEQQQYRELTGKPFYVWDCTKEELQQHYDEYVNLRAKWTIKEKTKEQDFFRMLILTELIEDLKDLNKI